MQSTRYIIGLDVHRDTIVACVYDAHRREPCGEAVLCAHEARELREFIAYVRTRFGEPHCCYEASCFGYVLYRSLKKLGVDCAVIAPGSIPRRTGDRIKTDRRDAEQLAEYFAAGLLTVCFVPDPQWESARNLVRSRVDRVEVLHRPKARVLALLRSRGHVYNRGKPWTQKFIRWLNHVELAHENDKHVLKGHLDQIDFLQAQIREVEQQIEKTAARPPFRDGVQVLQGFRGIGLFTAMQLLCELGDFRRFARPTALMAYLGLVPAQRSSGTTLWYGSITKTGNTHARKALVSAAWKYTYYPRVSAALQKRQQYCSARTIAISQRAQRRLYKRYQTLKRRKTPKVAVTAIARELSGFLWEAMQPA